MPRVLRQRLPEADHVLERVRDGRISDQELAKLARWLSSEPEVPEGRWFKRFVGFIVCGEGELINKFLLPGHLPPGNEI